MKKLLLFITLIALPFMLVACSNEDVDPDANGNDNNNGIVDETPNTDEDPIDGVENDDKDEIEPLPEDLNMSNIDQYLDRPNTQYIDLRNFDDKMAGGWIDGFHIIPFFGYLEYENILVRSGSTWTFTEDDIKSSRALQNLFDENKDIVLICAAGARAGYVREALLSLGYENVWNAGGLRDYNGDNMVRGDGEFNITMETKGDLTPGQHVGHVITTDRSGNELATVATIFVNSKGGMDKVFFDVVYPSGDTWTTKQALGYEYGMEASSPVGNEWFVQVNLLADALVSNQGWNTEWSMDDGTYFEDDAVAGVTVRVGAYKDAFDAAFAKASE